MTFNAAATVLGPVWYGLRGIWNWSFAFVILEAFACVQIGRGFWGDLAVEERERLSSVEAQIGLRQDQLDAAVNRGDANVDVFERNIQSLRTYSPTSSSTSSKPKTPACGSSSSGSECFRR